MDKMLLSRVKKFFKKLNSLDIKVVIFDLDLTASKMHSLGVLPRDQLKKFICSASEDFKTIVPLLYKRNFKLAIATFNDEAIYRFIDQNGGIFLPNENEKFQSKDLIAGEELVRKFLSYNFDEEIANSFFIAAYNPNLHDEDDDVSKNSHLSRISDFFKVNKSKCLLFDDKEENVESFKSNAFLVKGENGFKLDDFIFSK